MFENSRPDYVGTERGLFQVCVCLLGKFFSNRFTKIDFKILFFTLTHLLVYTRGVHLIVVLKFCKAHYRIYPYFTHFNRLMCSPLTETQLPILKPRLRLQISRLFWAHPTDTVK